MKNKLAKLKYLPNNYEIVEQGDHVICAVSNKDYAGKSKLLECRTSKPIFHLLKHN